MPLTVDDIIDIIDEATRAEVVEIEYREFGHPTTVNIDYTLNGIDDEFCVTVTEFSVEDS